jgi:hypothetical protein
MSRSDILLAFALLGAAGLVACARPIRIGPLIERYSRADCIPVRLGPAIQPPTRTWDHVLRIRGDAEVHVTGARCQVDESIWYTHGMANGSSPQLPAITSTQLTCALITHAAACTSGRAACPRFSVDSKPGYLNTISKNAAEPAVSASIRPCFHESARTARDVADRNGSSAVPERPTSVMSLEAMSDARSTRTSAKFPHTEAFHQAFCSCR